MRERKKEGEGEEEIQRESTVDVHSLLLLPTVLTRLQLESESALASVLLPSYLSFGTVQQ